MIRRSNGRTFEYSKNLQFAVKKYAQGLVAAHGGDGPPYDPFRIAAELNVGVNCEQLSGIDGYVEGKDGSYSAVISSNVVRVRQRFTLAHELCHVWLMRQADDGYPAPLIRYRNPRVMLGTHQDPAEEYLCNYFASELLIPREEVQKRLSSQVVKPKTILRLARDFQVSKQTAAIQLSKISKFVACCVWNLDSLWPLPIWWTGYRTSCESEIAKLESLVGKQEPVIEFWESYGTKRLKVVVEVEPFPKGHFSMIVIRHVSKYGPQKG